MTWPDETALLERGNRLVGWLLANNDRDVDWIPYTLRGHGVIESCVHSLLLRVIALSTFLNQPCTAELIPALLGWEGRRVAVQFTADARRVCGVLGRWQEGVLLWHVIRQVDSDPGEVLTFGTFRVIDRMIDPAVGAT